MTSAAGSPDKTQPDSVVFERAAAAGLKIGDLILGRYELRRILGRGTMGEVLEVRDTQSGNHYALKRVPPDMVRSTAAMEGIKRNFSLVSRLAHPQIATVRHLEIDDATSQAFLLMDLIAGPTLAEWVILKRRELNSNGLPFDLALGIAEQIALALDYAHSIPLSNSPDKARQYGLLHRDLKPANVMIDSAQEFKPGVPMVKLVDFGLAAEIQGGLQSLSVAQLDTNHGGTPVYMAPEQFEGRTQTSGVDQWALGVIIYELVAGRRPFDATTLEMLRDQILKADPEATAEFSPEQWLALKKTLQYDRKLRHASCAELIAALLRARRRDENSADVETLVKPVAVIVKKGIAPRVVAAIAAVPAIVLCAVAFWWWSTTGTISAAVAEAKLHLKATPEIRSAAREKLDAVIKKYDGKTFADVTEAKEISTLLAFGMTIGEFVDAKTTELLKSLHKRDK
jgi:hypothetical protein